jgi:hypothetical protein
MYSIYILKSFLVFKRTTKNITTIFDKKIKKIKKNFKNQFSKKFLKKSKIYVKFVVIFIQIHHKIIQYIQSFY